MSAGSELGPRAGAKDLNWGSDHSTYSWRMRKGTRALPAEKREMKFHGMGLFVTEFFAFHTFMDGRRLLMGSQLVILK